MLNWIKNIIISIAIRVVRSKIQDFIRLHPAEGVQLEQFILNLYSKSVNQFLAYCNNTLAGKNLDAISFPIYLKDLISPLDDKYENIIVKAIDGLDPGG